MELAFSTNAFKNYSLEYAIREISRIGYKGIEIMCDIPHAYPPDFTDNNIQETIKLIRNMRLEISNLNAFTLYAIGDVYHPSWIESSQDLRVLRVNHTINCINLASKLNAKNLSTEPGGPLNFQKNSIADKETLLRLFIKGLKQTSKFAEEKGIKILVEPEPGLLIQTSTEIIKVLKMIDSEFVKLNFDIGHFYCVNEDPATLIDKLSNYIEHFHLADISNDRIHYHLMPGKGSINFPEIFDAIKKIGYKGFITIELYPYQDRPSEVAEYSYEYLKKLM